MNKDIVAQIVGVAVSVPNKQFDLMDMDIDEYTLKRTMKLTGIHKIRQAPPDMSAADYCIDAAKVLFRELSVEASSIDGIVMLTPHPNYIYPGDSGLIQTALGIPTKCIAMDINHSCTGVIYGIFVASLLVESGQCQKVLVCCGDTATKHMNPRDRALKMVAGDGGSALLVTGGGKLPMKYSFVHDGSGLKYLYTPAGGERMPIKPGVTDIESTDAEGNVRSLQDEYMNGLEVMRFVLDEIPQQLEEALQKRAWSKEDVDTYVFHQANEFMIKSLVRSMQLDIKKVIINVDGYGNIGGASVLLAMCLERKNRNSWGKTVIGSFGTGMSGAVMTADFSNTHFCNVSEC
ncbi:3-oxoacyl-[acyl-carrier-protein] synthase-3 [Selenomonas sp. WCT3]|uniref:ketoacyl-ACP synthase III n=1 Tax=Selenomonas sp. WCT3 TaxID=3158785 RepID=UPI000891A4B3|nr:3-oxoacyl-[acyl-carrier-protein] synthase-3 [Selenomonas ruminantium]